jgi:hypothetical protein
MAFHVVKTPFQHWRQECAEEAGHPVNYKEIGHEWKYSEEAQSRREILTYRWLKDMRKFADDVMRDLPEVIPEEGFHRTYVRDSGVTSHAYTATPEEIYPSKFHGGNNFCLVRRAPEVVDPQHTYRTLDGSRVFHDRYGRVWSVRVGWWATYRGPSGVDMSVIRDNTVHRFLV